MTRSNWEGYGITSAHVHAAWWSAVVEPGDEDAYRLRECLGDEDAQKWVLADEPVPLPHTLNSDGMDYLRWKKAHERWTMRAHASRPEEDLGVLEGLGGRLIIPTDPQWPLAVNALGPAAPCALWVLGAPPPTGGVAIVGARASTQYGNYNARELAVHLAQADVAAISGGAFGIDIAAHRGAISAHGVTTAVMAGGLANLYPASHKADFAAMIAHRGSIVSEAPPNWRPARWRFLGRNRLIAALAEATIVVEAGMRSGALSTARHALQIGREVGAFPGMVTQEMSKGCNELIRNGATLVRDGADVMELISSIGTYQQGTLFGAPTAQDFGIDALAPSLRRVWDALPQRRTMRLETLIRESAMSERDVLAALAGLELAGLVTSSGGKWRRNNA